MTEGGGRCVYSLSIPLKLDSVEYSFCNHLMFAVNIIMHKQMQNSHCVHIVP